MTKRITAKVIQDSIDHRTNTRITSFELEYPRFIHSEFMTHRMLSRNAASSRAIPVAKLISLVKESPAMPVEWGKNQKGMQATELLTELQVVQAEHYWTKASEDAISNASTLDNLNVHKQITNRILEPFQYIKVVCTATEYDNFFHLRNHPDAQPEIRELAKAMWNAQEKSQPMVVHYNEWHVPYVERARKTPSSKMLYIIDGSYIHETIAVKISASCCAQVSYRLLDTDIQKAEVIYQRLVESKPVHASPFEHQATPISNVSNPYNSPESWPAGITHVDVKGRLWSGNFKNWIQHRQLISDHVCWEYEGVDNAVE